MYLIKSGYIFTLTLSILDIFMTKKEIFYKIWLIALLLTPIILWLLPATFFDEGTEICPSRVFLDTDCLGCGITRAVMHLHHFDVMEAFYYNAGIIWVYPFLVYSWFTWTKYALEELNLWHKLPLVKNKE